MPANLPPQYFEAEKRFRAARSAEEKIGALDEMLAIMPKHKGTDHLKAELRSRIAKLTQAAEKKSGTNRASMLIEKEGAAQVAVVGLPNAGKSQLVAGITHASPNVAEYPFTTYSVTPGMMAFENIQIQLLDTLPLVPQAIEWWFRHLLVRADALVVLVDLGDKPLAQMDAITAQLGDMRISFGERTVASDPELILYHKKALIVGNKMDLANARENYAGLEEGYGKLLPVMAISAKEGTGLDELRLKIFEMLDIIRVCTKAPGKMPDLTDPIILKRGSTLADAAASVHKDFAASLKYARIWGSGKYDGAMVKRDHILEDGDIVELHLK
ncbi:GTPase [Chloroflexota bacterium]